MGSQVSEYILVLEEYILVGTDTQVQVYGPRRKCTDSEIFFKLNFLIPR